jgi:hypothetical protein
VRDPWFPAILALIVLLAAWLGIIGPLPPGVTNWIQGWQSLIAATVASIAAYIAFTNTNRSLAHSERLEANRRQRKHAAVRAVLPLALSQISEYAERSSRELDKLVKSCAGEELPEGKATEKLLQPLPAETLKTLAEFIEYSDRVDARLVEAAVAAIQIHGARLRSIVEDNNDPSGERGVVRSQLEERIVDAASIYAAVGAAYAYARRQQDTLPRSITWDTVSGALNNMRFWHEDYPRLQEDIDRRARLTKGPFENVDLLSLKLSPATVDC